MSIDYRRKGEREKEERKPQARSLQKMQMHRFHRNRWAMFPSSKMKIWVKVKEEGGE